TRAVLDADAAGRRDYGVDHAAFLADLRTVERLAVASDRPRVAAIRAAVARYERMDAHMWGMVTRGRIHAADALVNGAGNDASDALVSAMTAYQTTLRAEEQSLALRSSSTASTVTWAV